ncbi:MAG: hypothetical protein ACXABY_04045 [Candidatus Thorarchaeota archaeon]|jgi:hypothetical protein
MDNSGYGEAQDFVVDRFVKWKNERENKTEMWDKYLRVWKVQEDREDAQEQSEKSMLKIPATKVVTDTASDNVASMVFSRTPFFEIRGRKPQDDMKAYITASYIEWLFERENFPNKYRQYIKEMCILGTAVGEIKVTQEVEETLERVPVMDDEFPGETIGWKTEIRETTINRPEFNPICLFDFFIETGARDVQSAEGCIVRSVPKLHALKKMERDGVIENTDALTIYTADMSD